MSYRVVFHEFATKEPSVIYEDRSVAVTTIPLQHRIPCCGFICWKPRPNHIIREMIDFYQVPVYELNRIKNGEDFVTPEGDVIANYAWQDLLLHPDAMHIVLIRFMERNSSTDFRSGLIVSWSNLCTDRVGPCKRDFFHTTAAQAAQIALDAEVKQLVIGHFSARYENEQVLLDEAAAIFPSTILAKENLCINL